MAAIALPALVLLAAAQSGCSPRTEAERAPAEIRGEPINPSAAQSGAENVIAAATPPLSPQPAAVPATVALEGSGEFLSIGFDKLSSFTYEVPDESSGPANPVPTAGKPGEQIPAAVKAFDKKRVALKGFMLPLRVEGGLITELLILRDQSMCCYGNVPRINEWVSVKMNGQGVKPIMDQVITLYGTLHVGEMHENGYLVGIYQMDGEKMSAPLD